MCFSHILSQWWTLITVYLMGLTSQLYKDQQVIVNWSAEHDSEGESL